MNTLCRMFGHDYDQIEKVMFEIKKSSYSAPSGQLTCKRCGYSKTFVGRTK